MEGGVVFMSAIKVQKEQLVEKIKQEVDASSVVIFADFRGLTVTELTSLRRAVKKEGGQISVYKNTLTKRALDELNISCPGPFLFGPSAVVHTTGDVVKMSKALVDFAKEADKLAIKGGILGKDAVDEANIKALAQLPSREELISKVIGTIKAPITNLVTALSSPTRGLVYVLSAIKEKKQEEN
jgi:large subunit ribosomal protein L10